MTRDVFIKEVLSTAVDMTPVGRIADELSPEEFSAVAEQLFADILKISKADVSGTKGYGEFDEENGLEHETLQMFLENEFSPEQEGYWKNWTQMFDTTMLSKGFFDKYYAKMMQYAPFCEGKRFLVNNNTFFCNMIVKEDGSVGFPDWSRSGVCDFFLDFAIMDLNKPYLMIPEKLYVYFKKIGMEVENFHERFLCMAYYKGIATLMWHASIDDEESCITIMKSISELEDRIWSIK
ncbi:MAG: hypothetical protein J6K15_04820 [Lachnospiraceae bacterium]|nr:hypothetical protein [Lachnospiraceae bacterium]